MNQSHPPFVPAAGSYGLPKGIMLGSSEYKVPDRQEDVEVPGRQPMVGYVPPGYPSLRISVYPVVQEFQDAQIGENRQSKNGRRHKAQKQPGHDAVGDSSHQRPDGQ